MPVYPNDIVPSGIADIINIKMTKAEFKPMLFICCELDGPEV